MDKTKVCKWFLDGEGRCFLNGSWCDCPFTNLYCQDLSSDMAPYEFDEHYKLNSLVSYESIRKEIDLNENDVIIERFVPDSKIDGICNPTLPIKGAREEVITNMLDFGYKIMYGDLWIYRNVILPSGEIGTYIVAKGT